MIKRTGLDCVMFIDDDSATNFINKKVIQNSQLDVHVAICDGGQVGLDYLTGKGEFSDRIKHPKPGIIFLDINMPAMNGWEFLEEYEKLHVDYQAKLVVAMLTTSLNPDDKEAGLKNKNVNEFMIKPLSVDMVMKLVDEHFPE